MMQVSSPTRWAIAALTMMAAVTVVAHRVEAADWPQWRGVERNGQSAETGLLGSWPEGGPPLLWKATGIGGGYSSLAVVGGRIYTLGDLEDGQYAIALSLDGEIVWKSRIGPVHEDRYGGPRSTPTVDGGWIFVLGTAGDLVSLEATTGNQRWRRSLPEDWSGYLMRAMGSYDWKWSESPLVDGDRVVVTPGHVEAMMVAVDADSGAEIWRTQGGRLGARGSDGAAYSSIVVSEAAGVRQYVQLVGRGVIGVEAATGKLLWSYNGVANDIAAIPTSIVFGDYVFSTSGYGTGAALLKIGPGEEGLAATEVYFLEADTLQNHHGGLILHQGYLYTGTGHNKGFPVAVEVLTGEVAWGPVRNEGKDSAAVTYADGRLYFRYQDGRMILVEATPEAYREHGTFLIPEIEKQSWSHPVIADGRLYLREQQNLFCYDVKAARTEEGAAAAE